MALNTECKTSASKATNSPCKKPDGFAYEGDILSHGTGTMTPKEMVGGKTPAIVKSKYNRTGKSMSTIKSPN